MLGEMQESAGRLQKFIQDLLLLYELKAVNGAGSNRLELEAADVNPDQNVRLQQYNQAEQQVVNDVAWMPIEQVRVPNLLKPCVKGVVFNASGVTPPDDWGSVYISTDTPCSNPA